MKMKSITIFSLALLISIAAGADKSQSPQTPEAAYTNIATAAQQGGWDQVYGALSETSKGQLDQALKQVAKSGLADSSAMEIISALSGLDLFTYMASETKKPIHPVVLGTILESKIDGDQATLRIKTGDQETNVQMVRENGDWKLIYTPEHPVIEPQPAPIIK